MKSLLVTIFLISVYTAECFTFSNEDDGALITDSSQSLPVGTKDPEQLRYLEDELNTNGDEADIEEKRNDRKTTEPQGKKEDKENDILNKILKDLGLLKNNLTSAMDNLTWSNSEIQKDVASIRQKLSNQGCPEGLFHFAPSDQCFLLLNDTSRNWWQSEWACAKKGLVLAQPYDPVGITQYIITRYGHATWTWIGAKGTGSYVKFQRTNRYIGSSNPLWQYRHPSSSNCLALTSHASSWKSYGTKVYYMTSCTNGYWTLCEHLPKEDS